MQTTKITSASIRIALSHNYSTFEVVLNLDNPEGIEASEIEKNRIICQTLATEAVNDYKRQPNANPKEELKRVENKLADIKALINEKPEEKPADPKEIAAVEALPLYSDVKANKVKAIAKPKKAVSNKVPNDIAGLGAND
ncbi:MAG: hypothetical protein P4L31_07595 [Candidatus Babeliales bacterium]|nr:hypothetical protein [Candidatus Babeliales bacterium]